MRIYLMLTAICLTLTSTAQRQYECSYAKNAIDEFTKTMGKVTNTQTVFNSGLQSGAFALGDFDGHKLLLVTHTIKAHGSAYCFGKESKIMIKTLTDSVITLPYVGDFDCGSSVYGGGSLTNINTGWFDLNDEVLEYLSNEIVVKVRLYFTDGYIEGELPPILKRPIGGFKIEGDKMTNPQRYFMNYAKCIQ